MPVKFVKKGKGEKPVVLKTTDTKVHPSVRWVYALGPEKAAVVDGLLARGESMPLVAKRIQEEWGLFPEMQRKTLEMRLYRYHLNIIKPRMIAQQAKLPPQKTEAVAEKLQERIDLLKDMADLIETQKKRVKFGAEQEETNKRLMREFHKDITALGNLYAQYLEMNMELGIIPRVSPKAPGVQVNVNTFASEGKFVQQVKVADSIQRMTLEALQLLRPPPVQQHAVNVIDGTAQPE